MVASGPAGPRRRLGAELRRLRTASGLHLDDVARELSFSTSKISRLETGKGVPKTADVRALIQLYGVTVDSEREMLLRLVQESRTEGWWESYTDGVAQERFFLDTPSRYPALETDAVGLRAFDLSVLHGLLQAEDYARAILAGQLPHHGEREIDQLVELRVRRQEALYRPAPLRLDVVVDESVLARTVGGPAVMAAQMRRLLDLMELPAVSIRVFPFAAGVVRAHRGHFVILDIPDDLGSTVVYSASDVDVYDDVFTEARRLALPPGESREAVRRYHDDFADREARSP